MSDGRCLLGTGRTDASADLAMLRVTSEANTRFSVCPLSVYFLPMAGAGDLHLVVDYHRCRHPRYVEKKENVNQFNDGMG